MPSLPCARAVLARWIADAFCEPAPGAGEPSGATGRAELLHKAAETLGLPPSPLFDGERSPADGGPLDARYRSLFGHSVRSECPLYEMEYSRGDVFQQAHVLADVAAFYRAFGLECSGDAHERPDHVSAQWELLSLLAWKEAQAAAWKLDPRGRPAGLDADAAVATCRDAQRAFLRDHAAGWMPAFFARVRRGDGDGFYGRVAALGEALLRHLCDAFNVPFGPAWLELRPFDEEDLEIECGPAAEPGRARLGAGLAQAMGGGERRAVVD